MCKIIAIAILILVTLIPSCYASTIEFDQAGRKSQIQLYIQKPISGKIGAYAYSCQTEGFGEVHTGITYTPTSYIQISTGVGQDTNGTRIAGSIWAGRGKLSGIYFLESGSGGTWDKLVMKYQATEKLALGYTKKQFAGQGVYVDFKVSKEITVKYSGFKTQELAWQLSF